MIKKTVIAALTASMILSLTGCASKEFVISREKTESETKTEEVKEENREPEAPAEEIPEEPAPKEPEEPGEPEPVPMTADEAGKIYDDFMAGNTKVTVPVDADHSSEIGMCYRNMIADGSECTLNEILDVLRKDVMERFEVSDDEMPDKEFKLENAIIDCGNDGMPELVIGAKLLVRLDEFNDFMIFKADDDGFRLCYSNSVGPRSTIDVNEYGYICEEGSSGASNSYYEKSFVDAKGQWHFLYGADQESDLINQSIYYNKELVSIPKKAAGDFKDIAFFKFWFDEKDEDERDYKYSYSVCGEYDEKCEEPYSYCSLSRDEAIYAKDTVYMQTFEKLGIPVIPLTDIDGMIAQKEKTEGVDDSIKEGGIVMESLGE